MSRNPPLAKIMTVPNSHLLRACPFVIIQISKSYDPRVFDNTNSQCLTIPYICTIAYRSNRESYNCQLVPTPAMCLSVYGRAMQAYPSWLSCTGTSWCKKIRWRTIGKRLPHWSSLQRNVLSRLIALTCAYGHCLWVYNND